MTPRAGINPITGSSRGFFRFGLFLAGGTASPKAWRTIRRCTPSFRATPWIVPTPNSCSRRISSNNSTFDLLVTGSLRSNSKLGTDSPGQLSGVGQLRLAKSWDGRPISDIPPVEFEQMYYQQQQFGLDEAGLN